LGFFVPQIVEKSAAHFRKIWGTKKLSMQRSGILKVFIYSDASPKRDHEIIPLPSLLRILMYRKSAAHFRKHKGTETVLSLSFEQQAKTPTETVLSLSFEKQAKTPTDSHSHSHSHTLTHSLTLKSPA
jgi:hypothetical protein